MENDKIPMREIYNSLSINDNTTVFHEEKYKFNAPHYYMVVDKNSVNNRENMVPNILGAFQFQLGPVKENGINGINEINLLSIVADRLEHFQNSEFACLENAEALKKVQEAIMWLNKRTNDRKLRNVEGTNKI